MMNKLKMMNNVNLVDVWEMIRTEASNASIAEPMLASFYHATILNHASFAASVSFHLANKLDSQASAYDSRYRFRSDAKKS